VLFKHRIDEVKLFTLKSNTNIAGFVKHTWNQDSTYQNIGCFFIALAPLITSISIVYASFVHSQNTMPIDVLIDLTKSPLGFGKLLLVSSIVFHCIPSLQDLKNAMKSALSLAVPIIVIAIIIYYGILFNYIDLDLEYRNIITLTVNTTTCVITLSQMFIWVSYLLIKLTKEKDQ
jgi:hypothetical protein